VTSANAVPGCSRLSGRLRLIPARLRLSVPYPFPRFRARSVHPVPQGSPRPWRAAPRPPRPDTWRRS
jgi:hypothetical protein